MKQMPNDEHTRAGAAWVGCIAARAAGSSAGARVTNVQDANFDDPASTPKIRSEAPAQTTSNDSRMTQMKKQSTASPKFRPPPLTSDI
jgi:hypothetical protein